MGYSGPKASNIYQNPGVKNNSDIKNPSLKGIGSPANYGKPVAQFNATLENKAEKGELNPGFTKAIMDNKNK